MAALAAAQQLYETYGALADPYMTLVGYFNSMRELGGVRRVVDDAVRSRLRQMDQRGLAQRIINPWGVDELTSRKSAADIPRLLSRLEAQFDPAQDSGSKKRRADNVGPLDVVLATNMISVGVDVNRLGLMVVASQPKATAEYIQATSRVGRSFPGLVCTVYNWARPRDLSRRNPKNGPAAQHRPRHPACGRGQCCSGRTASPAAWGQYRAMEQLVVDRRPDG